MTVNNVLGVNDLDTAYFHCIWQEGLRETTETTGNLVKIASHQDQDLNLKPSEYEVPVSIL